MTGARRVFVLAFALSAIGYFAFLRDKVSISLADAERVQAPVLVQLTPVYVREGRETRAQTVDVLIWPGQSRIVSFPSALPWSFRHLEIVAGHPRYQLFQQFEARNPHWHRFSMEIDMAPWARKAGGTVPVQIENIQQQAEEHLHWLQNVYLDHVEARDGTVALAASLRLLQSIAFAGQSNARDGEGGRADIGSLMENLERRLAERQRKPCEADQPPTQDELIVCGQAAVEVVWPD